MLDCKCVCVSVDSHVSEVILSLKTVLKITKNVELFKSNYAG